MEAGVIVVVLVLECGNGKDMDDLDELDDDEEELCDDLFIVLATLFAFVLLCKNIC
mgnify:CR=1 FL=1